MRRRRRRLARCCPPYRSVPSPPPLTPAGCGSHTHPSEAVLMIMEADLGGQHAHVPPPPTRAPRPTQLPSTLSVPVLVSRFPPRRLVQSCGGAPPLATTQLLRSAPPAVASATRRGRPRGGNKGGRGEGGGQSGYPGRRGQCGRQVLAEAPRGTGAPECMCCLGTGGGGAGVAPRLRIRSCHCLLHGIVWVAPGDHPPALKDSPPPVAVQLAHPATGAASIPPPAAVRGPLRHPPPSP